MLKLAASLATFTAVLLVYAWTLFPSIPGGDSGELVAEACHLGVAHPPGYPLYTMLVHVVTRVLPGGGSPAWRANMFSAACGGLAATFLQLTVGGRSWGAVLAGALFALSPLTWEYSVGSEVFALNNLAAAVLLWAVTRYARTRAWADVLLGAALCGVALTNQHTIVLFVAPIVCWVLFSERAQLSVARVRQLCTVFLLGLSPYLYLWWAARFNPQPGSWGDTGSAAGFLHHLRRGDYGTFRLFSSDQDSEGLSERLLAYAHDLVTSQSSALCGVLAVAGILHTLRAGLCGAVSDEPATEEKTRTTAVAAVGSRDAAVLLVVMYAFYLIVFHSLANLPLNEALLFGIHMRFWMQPNAVYFVWVGFGFDAIFRFACSRMSWLSSSLRPLVGGALAVALISSQLDAALPLSDHSESWHMHNYAKAILAPLPRNALLFTNYDQQWTSIRYLQRCEDFRRDVQVVQLSMSSFKWFAKRQRMYTKLRFPGTHLVGQGSDGHRNGGFTLQEVAEANFDHVSGVFLGGKALYNDPGFASAFEQLPAGLLTQLVPRSRIPSFDDWVASSDRAWDTVATAMPVLPAKERYTDRTWEWTVPRDYYMQLSARATYLLEQTIKRNSSLPLLAKSARLLEEVIVGQSGTGKAFLPAHTWKNLGLAYAHMVRNTAEDFPPGAPVPISELVAGAIGQPWRDRATQRFVEAWSQFLAEPEAKADPGYNHIAGIVKSMQTRRPSSPMGENSADRSDSKSRTPQSQQLAEAEGRATKTGKGKKKKRRKKNKNKNKKNKK